MRILVALGGNALLQKGEKGTLEEAQKNALVTCKQLAKLIEQGHELIITHGNGPQIGAIKLQNEIGASKVYSMPLHICGAESIGYLGFLLSQTFINVFNNQGIKKNVVSIITQVKVDENDPAFKNPTKPIGKFYTKEQADQLVKEGKKVVEDSGKGYRIVVPSPQPIEIIEGESIKILNDSGALVISAGGGGIPVIYKNGVLQGVDAVIDKDLVSAVLADYLNCDLLMILTDVDYAYTDFPYPEKRKPIVKMTIKEAQEMSHEFPEGNMGPKVKAGINFARATGKYTIITALDKAEDALERKIGTLIVP